MFDVGLARLGHIEEHCWAMRRAASLVSLVFLALVGCGSGQTGSPECIGGTSCVCERVQAGGALLRVRVDQFNGSLQASVVALVSPAEHAFGLVANERVAGYVVRERPCPGLGVPPWSLARRLWFSTIQVAATQSRSARERKRPRSAGAVARKRCATACSLGSCPGRSRSTSVPTNSSRPQRCLCS